jgi:hypothetical protein
VDLFRVFDWDRTSKGSLPGGPLFVPREKQGAGRHDIPSLDGIFYVTHNAAAAVAESIQGFRNQSLAGTDFYVEEDKIQALAHIALADSAALVDLNDPAQLLKRHLKPSDIATGDRALTRRVCAQLHEEGVDGFLWWSSLEASWTNATLFQSHVKKKLKLIEPVQSLTTSLPSVREAAARLRIRIEED